MFFSVFFTNDRTVEWEMDRWFSLVLQFSCSESGSESEHSNPCTQTHTRKHTHRLMTLIQMACLLCVYWPALKGIFYLFFPDKGICPVSTTVYLQISLAPVLINPKLCITDSVFAVFIGISIS